MGGYMFHDSVPSARALSTRVVSRGGEYLLCVSLIPVRSFAVSGCTTTRGSAKGMEGVCVLEELEGVGVRDGRWAV